MSAANEETVLPGDLERLFARSADRVFGFLLARCGSKELAEDLTSAAFEEAARAHASGHTDELSEAWLITVARRRLVDHWRGIGRDRRRFDQLRSRRLVEQVAAHPEPVHSDAPVLAALASLPDRQRAAITMRYLDDYSVSEVAEILGCSYASAESLLARGRRGLAAALEERTP